MNWMPTPTITARPIGPLLLAAGLFVTLSMGLVTLRESRDHISARHGDLTIAARVLASTIAEPTAAKNTAGIREGLHTIGRVSGLESITIFSTDGEILGETSARLFSTVPGSGNNWTLPFDLFEDRLHTIETAIRHGGQIVGTLQMTARGDTLGQRLAGQLGDLLFAALFAALAGLAVFDRLQNHARRRGNNPKPNADNGEQPDSDANIQPAARILALPEPDSPITTCKTRQEPDTFARVEANKDRPFAEQESQATTRAARALLVGFSTDDASNLARALDRIHIQSDLSPTGQSACNRALTGIYSLLFVECRGDQSAGSDLIRHIRQSESRRQRNRLPIVAGLDKVAWTPIETMVGYRGR